MSTVGDSNFDEAELETKSDVEKPRVRIQDSMEDLINKVDSIPSDPEPSNSEKSLDMVRNILFGEQARETEKRQASLERHISLSVAVLNEETQKKIEGLQNDIISLTNLLENETLQRKTEKNETHNQLRVQEQTIDKFRLQVLDERTELNQQIERNKHRVNQQMSDWRNDILQQLEATTTVLKSNKVDRVAMSELLNQMAQGLVETDTPNPVNNK